MKVGIFGSGMAAECAALLGELESLGTEQNRKVYRNHGVGGDQYGISYANLYRLGKRIGVDDLLATDLWASGNHDARVLATLIADPHGEDSDRLEGWVSDLDSYVLADALALYVAGTPLAVEKAVSWTGRLEEWPAACGWATLAHLAVREKGLPDEVFLPYVALIEASIHASPNRVRHNMNSALIAIGTRSSALEETALGVAARIGRVQVNHGKTSCKTPDATEYIRKSRRGTPAGKR